MKTFDEVKYRFESIQTAFITKGLDVEKLVLTPPVSETVVQKLEKKWKRRLPEEIRLFLLNTASEITFDWRDSVYMSTEVSASELDEPEIYGWPRAGGADFSLEKLDWIYSYYWPMIEEQFTREYYGHPSPYRYENSFPFIYGAGGEMFVYRDTNSESKCIYLGRCDSLIDEWSVISKSFYDFWEAWSLFGCPHFGGYEIFYDKEKQLIDPYGENGMKWRTAMGISHFGEQNSKSIIYQVTPQISEIPEPNREDELQSDICNGRFFTTDTLQIRLKSVEIATKRKGGCILHPAYVGKPSPEYVLRKYESKWQRGIPMKLRDFLSKNSCETCLKWSESDEMSADIMAFYESYKADTWPNHGELEMSFPKIDHMVRDWHFRCDEWHNKNPLEQYDCNCFFPFIQCEYDCNFNHIIGYYAHPAGEKGVFYIDSDDFKNNYRISASLHDFWNDWTLLGCPDIQKTKMFYDEKKNGIDPFSKIALEWRCALGIENLENTPIIEED